MTKSGNRYEVGDRVRTSNGAEFTVKEVPNARLGMKLYKLTDDAGNKYSAFASNLKLVKRAAE